MPWVASPRKLRRDVEREMERRRRAVVEADSTSSTSMDVYRNDPVGFCRDILGTEPTDRQAEILRALTEPPHQVMVKSANNIGKSYLSAIAAIWFYSTRDPASVVMTAPTFRQIVGITFKEVRRLYKGPGLFPRAPRIETSPFHVLQGFTATSEASFQGIREASNLVIFEECIGIDPDIWGAAAGMLSGGECMWLAIHNPTDSSSHAYVEEQSGSWRVFSLSALEHPNIIAELSGTLPPIPAAVRLHRLQVNMRNWGEFSNEDGKQGVDLLSPETYHLDSLPDGMMERVLDFFPGRYWTPTAPEGDSRVLGRYPSQSAYAIFSEWMFDRAEQTLVGLPWGRSALPIIGCDVARFGDDSTSIHVRKGVVSLHHESFRNRDTAHTAGRIKELCRRFADEAHVDPKRIPCHIDDTGVGGGVTDQADGFTFIGINFGEKARDEERYGKVRSEMLFDLAERMESGAVNLTRLPEKIRQDLRRQSVGITYKLDNKGRREAISTDKIKEELGRSPDDVMAFALAYYEPNWFDRPGVGDAVEPDKMPLPIESRQSKPKDQDSPMVSPFGTVAGGVPVTTLPDYDKWNRR